MINTELPLQDIELESYHARIDKSLQQKQQKKEIFMITPPHTAE